jgi:hypothetical protein
MNSVREPHVTGEGQVVTIAATKNALEETQRTQRQTLGLRVSVLVLSPESLVLSPA